MVVERRSSERTVAILEAAIPIVGACGYYGFSLKSLASACEMTVPGVLHHFGSKERLLLDLLKHLENENFQSVWEGIAVFNKDELEALSLEDVRRLLREAVTRSSKVPEITRLLSMLRTEALYPEHPAHDFFVGRSRRSIVAITHMFTGKSASPERTASLVLAQMIGLEILWLASPGGVDLVGLWDQAFEQLLADHNCTED